MFVLLFVLVLLFPVAADASLQPLSQRVQITLADGQLLWVTSQGTMDNLWVTTDDGQLLVEEQGYWFYAEYDSHGHVVSTGRSVVEGLAVKGIASKHISSQSLISSQSQQLSIQSASQPERTPYRFASGEYHRQPLLVVRVSFSNQGFRYTDAEIAQRLFAGEDSVTGYFLENSYNNFEVEAINENHGTVNDGIVSVRLNRNHPDFGNGFGVQSQDLARDALAALPQDLNLAAYDRNGDSWLDPNELAIVFMVAGYEQAFAGAGTSRPRVWAHKSSLYQGSYGAMQIGEYAMFGERHEDHQATIGIICHELGHLLFDLPDLYDRRGQSMGIGRWGLMGLGGWNSSAGHAGNKPAHMLGWSKEQLGFVQPGHAQEGRSTVRLRALSEAADVLEIPLDAYRHGQRLLLEHRRLNDFDSGLPGEGILMTRIDDRVGYGPLGGQNDNVDHQLVDVEEADGGQDLDNNRNRGDANDVFSSSDNTLVFSAVSPGPTAEENAIELLRMETGLVADIDLRVSKGIYGDNIGLDEVGPNSSYRFSDQEGKVIVRLPVSEDVVWLDGIDWFALGDGTVDIAVYAENPLLGEEPLFSQSSYAVSEGWNRLMFAQRLSNNGASEVFLQLSLRVAEGDLSLAIDAQGNASGDTYIQSSASGYNAANFDIPARLLVMMNNAPPAPASEPVDSGSNDVDNAADASSGSSSSGGGAMFVWLLLFVLVPRVRSL